MLEALPDKDGENVCNRGHLQHGRVRPVLRQQPVRWREGGLQEIRRTRSA
jgi:hypothetical protein